MLRASGAWVTIAAVETAYSKESREMANSLQDQLLTAGLVTQGQAKQLKQRSRKQKRSKASGSTQAGIDRQIRATQQAKQAHDRALNEEKERARVRKERRARMRQLLRSTRVNSKKAEDRYNFAVGGKLKSMYVTSGQRSQLGEGQLIVVAFGETLYLVPLEVMAKAREIDPDVVVHINQPEPQKEPDADDTYAGFEVPDDLMW